MAVLRAFSDRPFMTEAERVYQRHVDELILAATGAELEALQKIDCDSQLEGGTFYDVYSSAPRKSGHKPRIRPRRHTKG